MSLEMHEAIIGAPQGQGDSSPTYRQSIYQESPVNKLYENRLEMPTAQNLGYERTTPLKETPRPKTTPWSYSLN